MNSHFIHPVRLVVLDYPLKHWEDRDVQNMYCKMLSMKRSGYWGIHQNSGMLPVDHTDLIGTNYMLCYDTPFGLLPFHGYRAVHWSRCKFHRVTFPAVAALSASGQSTEPVEKILNRIENSQKDVSYHSSFTKNELMPIDKERTQRIRNIITGSVIGNARTVDEWISCSVVKFKMNENFDDLGAKPITGIFSHHSVFDQPVIM